MHSTGIEIKTVFPKREMNKKLFETCFIIFLKLIHVDFGLLSRVFANGPGDQDSIPGRVIQKTQKMVLDAALLNTQQYKVWIKIKVEQSRERGSTIPYISI